MPTIDFWAVLTDTAIPRDVRQRLLARQGARRNGRTPDPVPEGDKPFLARHVLRACAAHDELVLPREQGWAHLSDGQPCPPPEEETRYV